MPRSHPQQPAKQSPYHIGVAFRLLLHGDCSSGSDSPGIGGVIANPCDLTDGGCRLRPTYEHATATL